MEGEQEQYYTADGEYAEGEYNEGEYGEYQEGYEEGYEGGEMQEGEEVPEGYGEGYAEEDYNGAEQDNGEAHGVKRSAEEDDTPEVKRVRAALSEEAPGKNPVAELNEKLPGLEYKCLDSTGLVHAPMFTMQITVGGKVFEAQGTSKKKAKQICAVNALQYLAENNLNENSPSVRNSTRNPSGILNEIRPTSKYEFLEESEADGLRYYKMKLIVDDQEFIAKGRSKHLAKSYAAMEALKKIFDMKFIVPDFEQMPLFDGDEEDWKKYKKPKEALLFENRKPISELHSLYRPMPFDVLDNGEDVEPRFVCKLQIEGVSFTGKGRSRQFAKTLACLDALNYLKDNNLLEQKRAEAAVAREQRLAELKAEQEAAEQEAAEQAQAEGAAEEVGQ